MDVADIVVISVCAPLIVIMAVLCYVLLASLLKEEFDKTIWPFNKKEESYWYFFEDSVTPTFVCHSCNYKSDKKFWYCPSCGRLMKNGEEGHNVGYY